MNQPTELDRRNVSLAPLLRDSRVPWDDLHAAYDPLLRMVKILLGVVPNCDRYLEIWPPAFRTYNVMVPNLLNLPMPILGVGGPPAGHIGLSMYVSSRSAGCDYCSAHCCTFAMRRGASPETVAAALLPDRASFTSGELATIGVAAALGRVPCELTMDHKRALIAEFGERNAERIALAAVMMGFLNKFMDSVGVELEQDVMDEVSGTMGSDWVPGAAGADLNPSAPARSAPAADGLRTRLSVLPLLPGVIRWDRQVQRGVPSRWPGIGAHLERRLGHDFTALSRLHSRRAARAIATMLCTNFDAATTVVGLEAKVLAGLVFAAVVQNPQLRDDVDALGRRVGVDPATAASVIEFATQDTAPPAGTDRKLAAVLLLARAAAPSPAQVDAATVEACRGVLSPAELIELICWLSVLQMLHRVRSWIHPVG